MTRRSRPTATPTPGERVTRTAYRVARFSGGEPRTVNVPGELRTLRGREAIFAVYTNGPDVIWKAMHIDTRVTSELGVTRLEGAMGVSPPVVLTDGGLEVADRNETMGSILYLAPPGGTLVKVALPAGTQHVTFIDSRRGVALGKTGAEAWRTLDGGARWERVPIPLDGSAETVSIPPPGGGAALSCDDDGCTIAGGVVTLRGWGPFDMSVPKFLAANAASEPAKHPEWTDLYEDAPLGRGMLLTCETGEATASNPPAKVGHIVRMARGDREADLDVHARSIAWSGSDDRGAFRGQSDASSLVESGDVTYELWLATRSGALIERCAGTTCVPFWAAAGRRTVRLDRLAAAMANSGASLADALEMPDGGAAVVATGQASVVAVIAPDGGIRQQQAILPAARAHLARRKDDVGLATFARDAVVFHPIGGVVETWPMPQLYVCIDAKPPPGAPIVGADTRVQLGKEPSARGWSLRLAIMGQYACLYEAVMSTASDRNGPLPRGIARSARAGRVVSEHQNPLTGALVDRALGTRTRVRCTFGTFDPR